MDGSKFRYFLVTLLFNGLSASVLRDERAETYTPIVVWHGIGDSCCSPSSVGPFLDELRVRLPGIYVISLQIGNTTENEVINSYFLHPDKQIEMAYEIISNDPLLADGFNAVGISQGTQFMRGLIQRHPTIKVKNFISLGGQHQGVFGIPHCLEYLESEACDGLRTYLNNFAYQSWLQQGLVPAAYWHNPINESDYQELNSYIAEINNERTINEDYKQRLQALQNFVLVKYEGETVVVPPDSGWFDFYKPGQSVEILSLKDSPLYLEDRLGLKAMDENNQLFFLISPGKHVDIVWEWFEPNILDPYLRN